MTTALVLGGGLAGMAAAAALAPHVDTVIVVESDRLPAGPEPRRGLPQAHHNHVLMAGGAKALDALLPGTTARLYEAGAHHRKIGRFLLLGPDVWSRCSDGDAFAITCSRHLVDHTVRSQALAGGKVELIDGTKVIGLVGDQSRVTGARVEAEDGAVRVIRADLVVDATGSRSKATQWLTDLRVGPVKEDLLDTGLAYVGRTYEQPAGFGADFPGVLIQARPGSGPEAAGGALMPQEDGRWIVALMGPRGNHPPTDEAEFLAFARAMRHSVIGDLLAEARPVTPMRSARGLANRRRHFDRARMPEGFLALGDAVMILSPNFGTGMAVAAMGALALRTQLERSGFGPGLARRVQKAVAGIGAGPWQMAITNDRWFPGVETNLKLSGGDGQRKFGVRFAKVIADNPAVARRMQDISALVAPLSTMMSPSMMFAVMRGPQRPPLTAAEAIGQFPQLASVRPGAAPGRLPEPADAAQ
ncbi:NAD(P)/FAD-dependent oxidoreductase [Catellatospora tritici]|uniref:NAD(P)/FAD-dependent oxidoreductase n=1 Tax=Catellatospora tritici TaxID=2851566 RepID=UPI001C2DEDB1|nr:FAD-dependent monooxygenase [Catellatospora tritici]MBV1855136.1 FAD-dependent monooxygenase [Catellatospora tritici]